MQDLLNSNKEVSQPSYGRYLSENMMTLIKEISDKPQFESLEFVEPENAPLEKEFGPNRKEAPTLFSARDVIDVVLKKTFTMMESLKDSYKVQSFNILQAFYDMGISLMRIRSIHPLTIQCTQPEGKFSNSEFVYQKDLLKVAHVIFQMGTYGSLNQSNSLPYVYVDDKTKAFLIGMKESLTTPVLKKTRLDIVGNIGKKEGAKGRRRVPYTAMVEK